MPEVVASASEGRLLCGLGDVDERGGVLVGLLRRAYLRVRTAAKQPVERAAKEAGSMTVISGVRRIQGKPERMGYGK